MKQCPNCGLYSPDTATRCDCSYNFEKAELEDKSRKVNKGAWKWNVMVNVLLVLGLILATGIGIALKETIMSYMRRFW